jgi:hypothetical protein
VNAASRLWSFSIAFLFSYMYWKLCYEGAVSAGFTSWMISWIISVLHTSRMWVLYIQMCHLLTRQLLFRVCFICSEGSLKIRHHITSYVTIQQQAMERIYHFSTSQEEFLILCVAFIILTMVVAVLTATESMSYMCMKFVQKNECVFVYENIHELKMLQQIPLSYLCSHKSSMS